VNLNATGSIIASNGNSAGILGGWATFGTVAAPATTWAVTNGAGAITGFSTFTTTTTAGTTAATYNNVNIDVTNSAGLIGGTIIIAAVGIVPAVIQFVGLGAILKWLILIVQWPVLICVVLFSLAVLYRYAPNREPAQWKWVSPGAAIATILWLLGSLGFSIYVANFNSYNATYGSLGGVVILLTWLYLSSFVALLGAVINAQAERQTQHDSTTSPSRPMGARGAYAADTVGEATG